MRQPPLSTSSSTAHCFNQITPALDHQVSPGHLRDSFTRVLTRSGSCQRSHETPPNRRTLARRLSAPLDPLVDQLALPRRARQARFRPHWSRYWRKGQHVRHEDCRQALGLPDASGESRTSQSTSIFDLRPPLCDSPSNNLISTSSPSYVSACGTRKRTRNVEYRASSPLSSRRPRSTSSCHTSQEATFR